MRRSLQESAARVVCTPKPINFARYAARVFGLPNLRGTQDPLASVGYRSLAQEMAEACPEAAALFTFASSGVSSTGLLDGYERRAFGPTPSLWAVQSGRSIGIVRAGDPEIVEELESPAGRLGIRNPPDADALLARLRSTGGGAVVVRSAAIERWAARMENEGLRTSAEGPAVLAAIEDVRASGALRPGPVIAVITGHRSQWDRWTSDADNSADLRAEGPSPPLQVETYLELRSLLLGWGWEAVS